MTINNIVLYNNLGQVVRTETANNRTAFDWSLVNYASGIYMLRIQAEEGIIIKQVSKP